MAASVLASEQAQEVFSWLRALPLAPEYHPTLAEFQDPISYIFKIEKEASKYGICKIVPPVLPSPKKTVIANLNRSLAARAAVSEGNSESRPVFTTRQQQIGFCPRKSSPVQKPVWQSGEHYTFPQFEAKAKTFEKNYLKKCAKKGGLSALEIESLYWKATVDKPFSVEYANDMPGSAFIPINAGKCKDAGEGVTLGETAWNMRGVSRSKGSLLRFMKEEIPGVTSPMVYIAMMFSWFAWHVEDHDLHSLNYLHMGAAKTWYGVPREAAVAFEEVVRIHGYGGEINPLVTFAVLGEKTTVLSPEMFIGAGVPCCRLVQNAGEFVVTFPRAYHTGFSHGFNCGEAANIATPEWLNIAKDAAIRRASINYPPMLSHYQLLYDLALALCSSIHVRINAEPRSSRLKVKKKGEGETVIKELFVQNVVQNNKLLQILGRGYSVVFLPQSSSDVSGTKLRGGFPPRINPRLSIGFCSSEGFSKYEKGFGSRYLKPDQIQGMNQVRGFCSIKRKSSFSYDKNRISSHDLFSNSYEGCENDDLYSSKSKTISIGSERESTIQDDGLSDQRLFSCVTCGILCFSCAAIIQPRESSANYLMSADCSFLNDWLAGSRATSDGFAIRDGRALTYEKSIFGDYHRMEKRVPDGLYDVPVQSVDYHDEITDRSYEAISGTETKNNTSALGLLALNYGNMSDSEEDQVEPSISIDVGNETNMKSCSSESKYQPETTSLPSIELRKDGSPEILDGESACDRVNSKDTTIDCSIKYNTNEISFQKSNVLAGRFKDSTITGSHPVQSAVTGDYDGKSKFGEAILPVGSETTSFVQKSDEDSSRLHVFCLEHAIQVEKQLREIGGVHILLYCHPDYPTIEGEAKALAEEMGMDYLWNAIKFQQASKEDEERIHSALDSEEGIPGNGDWAVKLGINLFYSANLCRSSLYSKQMPYNSVIYRAFGRSSSTTLSTKPNFTKKRSTRCGKAFVGKWCGKVWTSNQVHPLLNRNENEEEEEDDVDDDLPFHDWEVPVERKSSRIGKSVANLTTKITRSKRKLTPGGGSTKKKKRVCTDDVASDDVSPGDGSNQVHPLLSKKDYEGEEEIDDYESRFHTWEMSVERKSRGIRKFEPKSGENLNDRKDGSKRKSTSGGGSIKKSNKLRTDAVPDDLIEDLRRQRRRILRSKLSVERNSDDLSEGNSSPLQKKISVGKLAKFSGTEYSTSDDSLVDHHPQRNKISIRSKKAKSIEVKSSFSDDSFGDDSNQRRTRICRSKKGKNIEGELSPSDESQGNYSPLHERQVSGKRQNKYVDKEDGHLNEVEDTFLKYQRRASRIKQTKCVAMENDLSDDSLEHKSMSRIKQVKNFENESTFSDENTPLKQSKRKSRSSQQRGLETEDGDTDGELEDSQPTGRILRSKQPNLKQVTPMHVKQRSRQSTKQESGRLVKIEASEKSKQSHSRLRNSKDKQKTRQSDSDTDEAIEDEPTKRLRKRTVKTLKKSEVKPKENKLNNKNKVKNPSAANSFSSHKNSKAREVEGGEYPCDIEGCSMSFSAKQELILHKRNICPVKGCGKKFFSHKYLVQHRRVHIDDRPLKCPWKGCKMTFKWAWARTEHIRVHTGARPYVCNEAGCGQTFRFVSDFSRHKRKTGHSEKKGRGDDDYPKQVAFD